MGDRISIKGLSQMKEVKEDSNSIQFSSFFLITKKSSPTAIVLLFLIYIPFKGTYK